jgi:hypothetical protein
LFTSTYILTFKQCFKNDISEISSVKDLLNFILIKKISLSSSFSEITVASVERFFSKLKLIKNYLRNIMTQQRLSNLAIISIENKVAKSLDVSNLVTSFATAEARKKF